MHFGHAIGYEGGERLASPPTCAPHERRLVCPLSENFRRGGGAARFWPRGGEAGLARVTYFDAITLAGRGHFVMGATRHCEGFGPVMHFGSAIG